MRADRRIYGRASALPLHVLLSTKASPPRALITKLVHRHIHNEVRETQSPILSDSAVAELRKVLPSVPLHSSLPGAYQPF